jgi:DNA (cytosine-5)-methyltransferase 1
VLDLCSGAGGAAKGYHDAGFDVIGVDIAPQRNFPYEFIRADALEVLRTLVSGHPVGAYAREIDLIHVSAPCQRWSRQARCRPGLREKYPDLITPARPLLRELHGVHGIPYVIENVPEAPLVNPVMLCGHMFGRELYRHRHFETSFPLSQPGHLPHLVPASRAGHWVPGTIMSVAGHIAPVSHAREIMEITWTNREELAEAIPPYYTEWIARNSGHAA